MKKNVSLKDIAEKVGVSTALVSYVLNNKFKDRINKEVAANIRQAAKDLNYQPNQIARSLKAQKTFTIGLILADIANPFSSQIARIVEDEKK
jgi:LacI family transcriptional regulator